MFLNLIDRALGTFVDIGLSISSISPSEPLFTMKKIVSMSNPSFDYSYTTEASEAGPETPQDARLPLATLRPLRHIRYVNINFKFGY